MSDQLFINPYNFIPFGSDIEKKRRSRESAYRGQERLVSGWLTVELDTKTPLIIPDGAHPKYWDMDKRRYIDNPSDDEKKDLHKEYDFLRLPGEAEEEPVIPGSELRGMLRSVYEAVTDSCTAFLLDDKPISQRIPTFVSLQDRGLLAYEETSPGSGERRWVLYSACADKKIPVNVVEDELKYKDGNPVTEQNGDFIADRGWLQYNIPIRPKKGSYHIVYLKEKDKIYTWDFIGEDGTPDQEKNEEPYRALKSALIDRPDDQENRNKIPNENLQKALERAKEGKGNKVPVFYMKVKRGEETLIYLSNSSIGRIAQRRKWEEIMGVHAPCDDTAKLCPACLLFGTTRGKGMKGHIRITDARPVSNLEKEIHTLQILEKPKSSAFEFYLRKPKGKKATYWNFDFYGEKVKGTDGKEKTDYHDLEQATPRGRKMYWYSTISQDAPKDRMNATMEAMKGSFEFKIYFDEITKEQLQNLIWVVTLGENRKNSTRQHKLGHAKPLGYGSAKLIVTEKVLRHISMEGESVEIKLEKTDYQDIPIKQGKELDSEAVKNLLVMCDTKSVPEGVPVMYPSEWDKNKEEYTIYSWFANNRKNAKWLRTLPEPTDQRLTLRGRWDESDSISSNIARKGQKGRTDQGVSRAAGKVKFFKADQNFGYITGEDGIDYKITINVYNPDIQAGDLRKGASVTFVPKKLKERWVANQCRVEE